MSYSELNCSCWWHCDVGVSAPDSRTYDYWFQGWYYHLVVSLDKKLWATLPLSSKCAKKVMSDSPVLVDLGLVASKLGLLGFFFWAGLQIT